MIEDIYVLLEDRYIQYIYIIIYRENIDILQYLQAYIRFLLIYTEFTNFVTILHRSLSCDALYSHSWHCLWWNLTWWDFAFYKIESQVSSLLVSINLLPMCVLTIWHNILVQNFKCCAIYTLVKFPLQLVAQTKIHQSPASQIWTNSMIAQKIWNLSFLILLTFTCKNIT